MSPRRGLSTRCIHAGEAPDPTTGAGMAAISATLLHLLATGGHLVASGDVYAVIPMSTPDQKEQT